ncbi:hypothetical protein A2U01_0078428, partial [Trifolium medium]|nr:hypothetical protein [Trifolium medium]
IVLQRLADSFYRIRGKQDSLLEPEAGLLAQVVAEVELVVVAQISAAVRPASFPYDASRPAPAVLDIGGASLVAAATIEPTYSLQG